MINLPETFIEDVFALIALMSLWLLPLMIGAAIAEWRERKTK